MGAQGVPGPSRLILSLAQVCQNHPTDEKSLILPTYQIGWEILEALASHTGGWLNIRLVTPLSLALEAASTEIAADGYTLVPPPLAESILHTAYDATPNVFFPEKPTPGLLAAIRNAVEELRLTGIRPEELKALHAIDPAKAKDLAAILARYEAELAHARALDGPGVFQMAMKVSPAGRGLYLIPESLRVIGLARRFLEVFTGGAAVVLREDPVLGLDPPGWRFAAPEPAGAVSPHSYFFAPEALLSDRPTLDIFAAVGQRNECRTVLGRLLEHEAPFDKVEIILADYPTYAPLLDDLRRELGGLPMTFSGGLPACRSGPARALAAFARWIRDGFPENALRRLVASGDLKGPEGLSGRRVARVLRAAKIGWGANRYAACLNGHCEELRRRLEKADEDETKERRAARLDEALKARDWILDILGLVLLEDAPLADFLRAARSFLDRHVAIRSESDGTAVGQLRERLAEDARYDARVVPTAEATERIIALAESVSVNASGPQPGHLHVAGIRQAGYSGRPVTFILGLDDIRFPGATLQDPILSDPERSLLSPELATSAGRSREKLYSLAELLARLRGRLTLSYPAFDLSDNRRRFPSPVLLQAHRLRTGDRSTDYQALIQAIGPPVGFVSGGRALSPNQWWLSHIHDHGLLLDARQSVLTAFSDLARGARAEEARARPEATAYDGKILPAPELDPRTNRDLTVSASRLERYPDCPRRYYLQYVLEVELPDDLVIEPGVWLDPMTRGLLLHEFYHRLLADLTRRKERPDPQAHLGRAHAVLAEVIAEYKTRVPPPSEAVFDLEVEELRRSVKVFLQGEAEHRSRNTPTYFEVSFGLKATEGIGLLDPVEIHLHGGPISCRGKIDRIDRRPAAHEWEVWDYKTGTSRYFAANNYTAGGTQLQHAIYALAAEQFLRQTADPQATVVGSGYLFPTERGRGEAFRRDPARTPEAREVIGRILDLIRDGMFVGRGERCTFCDYAALCGSGAKARWKTLEGAGDPGVGRLAEVRDHA
jgi:RecB family exonuclease